MKKQLLSILFSMSVLGLMAFGDQETRKLSSFEKISVSSGIKATLVKGSTNKIDIEVEGVDLDKVITDVDGDKLKVKIDQKWWGSRSKSRKVEVVITYTEELEYIGASSGSSVKSENVIKSSSLDLDSSSGASNNLEIESDDVTADVSSGASLTLAGTANSIDIDVSSGSSFRGFDLKSKNVMVDVSSGASARVHATEKLDADVSSGGSVRYKGNPASKIIDKSSGGSVKPAS